MTAARISVHDTDSRPLREMLFQVCTKVANALHMNVGVIRLNHKNNYSNFVRVVIASSATNMCTQCICIT